MFEYAATNLILEYWSGSYSSENPHIFLSDPPLNTQIPGSGEDEPEPVGEAEEGPGIVHVGEEPEGAPAHRCPQHTKYKHPERNNWLDKW